MLRKLCIITTLLGFFFSSAQDEETIGKAIEELTISWDMESAYLAEYTGFKEFCTNEFYRDGVIKLLADIHHYDSVLYIRLSDAQRFKKNKEIKKTLEDIKKFEAEYDMKSLLKFLNQECIGLSKIDRKKEELDSDIGSESYDGQKYIIITEITKYIHHITKRVDLLRTHVHHLHIK